jgi:predicted TIM-barrel fold metal-dependent hydrolase
MLERFDHQFEIFGSRDQSMRPSELFTRQCMISFDPDESALPFCAQRIGADKILWASDYPHPDAKIPGVVKELIEAVEPLASADRRRVLGANARAFYRL